jgi:uncharacterized FlgJ-related protein
MLKLNKTTLKYEKYFPKWILITIIILISYSSIATYLFYTKENSIYPIIINNSTIVKTDTFKSKKLNAKNLLKEIKNNRIYFPEIVLKQAILETNSFKSNICIENNNLFGIRHYPNSDTTYAIAKNRGFLCFKTWEDSVKEYKRLQKRNFKESYYYDFLERGGYAEKNVYVKALKTININD